MKIWQKILLLLGMILLLAGALSYDAYYAAAQRFTPRYETREFDSYEMKRHSEYAISTGNNLVFIC